MSGWDHKQQSPGVTTTVNGIAQSGDTQSGDAQFDESGQT